MNGEGEVPRNLFWWYARIGGERCCFTDMLGFIGPVPVAEEAGEQDRRVTREAWLREIGVRPVS